MQAIIHRIETFAVRYPVAGHFKFFPSRGGRPAGRESVLVKVTDTTGEVGWGQSVPAPTWSYETLETVQTTLENYLAPALLGQDAFDEARIGAILERTIAPSFSIGQPLAKAGLDLALFDLTGRRLGQLALARWNRSGRREITLSWTLNPRSLEELPRQIEQAHLRGYRHFNLKVAPDADFDLAVCREIRRLAPQAFLWVDANGGYDLQTALKVAPRFAEMGVAAFEQPLPANRLSGFARLKRQGALPVLMDEPLVSTVELEEFHQLGLLDGAALKVARCGGLGEARRMLAFLEENGLLIFGSGLTDPDLSLAASLALFAAGEIQRPAALNGPQLLSGSLLQEPIPIAGDQATVPTDPGLGVEIDDDILRSW